MNNKTKIILTVIGLAAIVLPAILLYLLTANKSSGGTPNLSTGGRQINQSSIQNEINSSKPVQVMSSPSPSPVLVTPSTLPTFSPSTKTSESSSSSH